MVTHWETDLEFERVGESSQPGAVSEDTGPDSVP